MKEISISSRNQQGFIIGGSIAVLLCLANFANAQVELQILREPHQKDGQYMYYSIACSDKNNCTVVGNIYDTTLNPNPPMKVLIERTTDGGNSWKRQESGIPNQLSFPYGKFLKKVIAIDSSLLFAVGDSGLILRTTDAGANWVTLKSNTKNRFYDVSFSDQLNGIAVATKRLLLTTTDGGDTWEDKSLTPPVFTEYCHAFSATEQSILGYAFGPVYRTNDGWVTWDSGSIFPDTISQNIYRAVTRAHYFDKQNLLAYGAHYVDGGSVSLGNQYITKSTDGGNTWVDIYDNRKYMSNALFSMSFNGDRGVACGIGQGILHTTDKGVTWIEDTIVASSYGFDLKSSSFPIGDDVFFVGSTLLIGGVLKLHFPSLLQTESYEEVVYGTHLYPNPASETVTIRTTYSDAKEIYLFDALGRKVMTIPCEGKEEVVVSCNDLPTGIYRTVISWRNRSIPGKQLVIMR
jgi:photosystem II stability/assembly factor-like uncharacterized protein